MNTMTTGVALTIVLLSAGMNSVRVQADELLTRQQTFVPDTMYRQWINERNGHDGVLNVHGTLLSSPCTLQTNEITLPLPSEMQGYGPRTPLSVALTGCGYGDPLTGKATSAGQTSVTVVYSALLTGQSGGFLHTTQRMPAVARAVLYGGSAQLTWYLNDVQRQLMTSSTRPSSPATVLRLRMDYE